MAEAYRILGTKLPLSAAGADAIGRTLAVSSVEIEEDAGEIAANLAVVLAQTGNRVVLVDANPHHATIGAAFGFGDHFGLTKMLTSHGEVGKVLAVSWAPGLAVLPSGPPIVDAFARLASPRMIDILNILKKQADLVIVVTSPLYTFADSLLLTSRVDGVIVSVRSGQVHQEPVEDVMNSLESIGAKVLGTVLFQRSLSLSARFAQLRSYLKASIASRQRPAVADGESDQWSALGEDRVSGSDVETASNEGGAATSQ
jgi:capsular exopolysaccharide synthesis family protein